MNRIMEEVKRILSCGAKNSTITRALMGAGFYYVTYGWDIVCDGCYWEYSNDERDWLQTDNVAGLCHEDDARGDFEYFERIKPGDIPALKQLYLS